MTASERHDRRSALRHAPRGSSGNSALDPLTGEPKPKPKPKPKTEPEPEPPDGISFAEILDSADPIAFATMKPAEPAASSPWTC